ncbi:hypothetical protein ES332_D12G149400v1 [Gossypium tomentosum]|uniref:Uncharacterized protein n=1 Tax=Gossypium tomentosum TaxID=34277 RepID=A0A5D2IAA9_GOSTO|nr:hypothetical protein ES332_D12G149400v1 [Gossypium tomentosum]
MPRRVDLAASGSALFKKNILVSSARVSTLAFSSARDSVDPRCDYPVNGGRSCTPKGFLALPRADPKALPGTAYEIGDVARTEARTWHVRRRAVLGVTVAALVPFPKPWGSYFVSVLG